jgi:hypothetical protein
MLTQTLLKEKLLYDPLTGVFTWKCGKYKDKPAGTIAGKLPNQGYIRVNIDKKAYVAHRLAWLYMYGKFPAEYLDHVNRNRENNRIANLRIANASVNSKNQTIYKNSPTGHHGVTAHGGRWRARINVLGKKYP